jgi:hypothetical protein
MKYEIFNCLSIFSLGISEKSFNDVYTKPWCRIGPFIIGILLGYFVHQLKQEQKTVKIDRVCVLSTYCLP